MNLQIQSENDMAITTKKSKVSLTLSQSDDDQNMQPFSCQTVSSSCIVSSHPLHGPPSNNSYSFVHLMLHIHRGIWDYLLSSHLRHLQCCHHWCYQLQAEFMLALKDGFHFKTLHALQEDGCTYRNGIIYTIGMETNYTIPVCTTVFLKMYRWVRNM